MCGRVLASSVAYVGDAQAAQVVIACSHEASHFFLMPRYDALRQVLGEDVGIRILTYHHYVQSLPADPSADISDDAAFAELLALNLANCR